MTLITTSFLNAAAVAIKMLIMLGINKTLAIYVGPAGYAAVGQFQNAVQIITAIAGSSLNMGVTSYTAQYQHDENRQRVVWQTAGSIQVILSLLISFVIFIFNNELALWFFNNYEFKDIFTWFAAALSLFCLNSFFLSILNGNKQIKLYTISNIVGSALSGTIAIILTIKGGLHGALVGLAIYQSLAFFVTLYICYRLSWFKWSNLIGKIDQSTLNNLSKYALMSLSIAVCGPTTYILIRDHLIQEFGLNTAGYWEAGMRISSAYLLFFTTTMSIYFLPKVAAMTDGLEIKKLLFCDYKKIAIFSIAASIPIYIFDDFLINFLFTSSFLPVVDLLPYIIIADNIKVAAWVISYALIAKGAMKIFIAGEFIFSFIYFLLALIFVSHFGLNGVLIASVITSGLYLFYVYFGLIHILKKHHE